MLTDRIIALAFLSVKGIVMMNWKLHKANGFSIVSWLKVFMDLLWLERAASALIEYDHGDDGL